MLQWVTLHCKILQKQSNLRISLKVYCQVYAYTVYSPISAKLYFKVLQIIISQNINSPSGAICRVFGNLIKIMKFSRINTLYLFLFLRTNNCAVISLELLTVMNMNLNGNTAGSFPIVLKISSSKSSENFPYVLTIVPSSRNAQLYLNNDIVIFSQL